MFVFSANLKNKKTCIYVFCSAAFWFRGGSLGSAFYEQVRKMAVASKHVCKLCNLLYPEDQGRVHGATFTCNSCGAADRALRRHLGDKNELQQFSKQEVQDFFRKVQESKETNQGRLMWKTIRSTLVNYVTQRQILQFKTDVECAALPLSVYLAQGWEESVVKNCPSVFNETLGVETYKVPVQRDTWTQTFERVVERVLAQEKAASLQKKKKGLPADSGDELDLAVPAAAGKQEKNSEKTAEKKAAAEQKKICASNLKVSGQAAKALGPLTNALTALDRLEARVGKAQVEVDAGTLKTAVDVRNNLEGWTKAARDAVNNQEAQKQVPDTEKKSIGSLPFQADGVRTLLQQNAAVQKELKALLPVPVKKPKKEKQEDGAGDATQPAPKRRRTKAPA